ncbi:MAG: hypothetical protein JNK63_06480 [Chthonomonas sp.]|nr:hypothetical protein [Chthonomonas sp.]
MNAKWLFSIILLVFLGTMLSAQTSRDQRGKRADEILIKIRRMDLANQILPLVLTKDQLDKLLPAIEKARTEGRKAEEVELEMLTKVEANVDLALKEAYEDQKLPKQETMVQVASTFKTMRLRRGAITSDNVDAVMAVVEKELNAGQKKAAANAVQPSLFDPTLDPSKMSDTEKLRFYVQAILLDYEAYDVLLQMRAKRK